MVSAWLLNSSFVLIIDPIIEQTLTSIHEKDHVMKQQDILPTTTRDTPLTAIERIVKKKIE